jgi:MFS family permease
MSPQYSYKIPPLIKRNILFLAVTQAFVGMGSQMVPALSAIMVEKILGSEFFSGIGTSILYLAKCVISYHIGKVADSLGRKRAIMFGLLLGIPGAILIGLSISWLSFPWFLVGMFIFGSAIAATHQLRIAAADMYPASRRGEGIGYVQTGSILGALGAPLLIMVASRWALELGQEAMSLTWFFVPAVILPSMILVRYINPDPKEIAEHLWEYYPEYSTPKSEARVSQNISMLTFIRDYQKLTVFFTSFAVQGIMAMIMAMTSLALSHQGHSHATISLAVGIHVVGMYGFAIPLGLLSDRMGRRATLLIGLAFTLGGAVLVAASPSYLVITGGTFLVGVGWSCVNGAAAAFIGDTTSPEERGRALGTNETFSYASAIFLPLIAGAGIERFGFSFLGVISFGLVIIPFFLLLKLKELHTGTAHAIHA